MLCCRWSISFYSSVMIMRRATKGDDNKKYLDVQQKVIFSHDVSYYNIVLLDLLC